MQSLINHGSKYVVLQYSTCLIHGTMNYGTIPIPTQARVVIAGAGVVANSVAYHLVQKGWRDVVVLEQNKIGSGSSHFGSGTLGLFKPIAHRNLIWYSIKLYQELQDMGFDIGMKNCGSLNLAQSKDRLIALRRRIAYNVPTGLHCELLTPAELRSRHPHISTGDLSGGVWVPDDAVADPAAICRALAELAQGTGAQYFENVQVERVETRAGRVHAVHVQDARDEGDEYGTVAAAAAVSETRRRRHRRIRCEYFVNCAGMWARELGLLCAPEVRIPAYPAEHFYATTDPLADIGEQFPCIRDFDSHTYMREYNGGVMVGWFEPNAKAAFEDKQIPKKWTRHSTNDWKHFQPLWDKAIRRLPVLAEQTRPHLVNSPDNFTPDGRWIMGEAPTVSNYFVACGMNGNSLQGAGGIGNAVAEWIIEGRPTQDLLPFHIQRFLNVHNSRRYLQQRTKEVVGRNYSILYPLQCEYKEARKLRCSPLYSVLEKRGAVFGIKMAYERALYFDSTYARGDPIPDMPPGSFYKPKFFDFMREENLACRESVGIIDMSSFSKITLKSDTSEVVDYLQHLCSNDIDIAVGGIVHTGMQNEHGGYENDCMLVRQSANNFFMVSPTSQQTRVYEWMCRNRPVDSRVDLNDVTSMYTVINVVGPKAAELLSELSNSSMLLPPFTYRKVNVGYASDVMVMSFTHTGDPGYCLYIPSEYALHVYYRLMTVGRDYGVRDVGTLTQRFMRIERFIPFWAEELTSFTTPFEAGNSYSVKLDKKDDFIGRSALYHQKQKGVKKQLVSFQLKDIDIEKDIWPWGGEPVYRNKEFVGTVTSAGYGFQTNKLTCLGFVHRPSSSTVKTISSDYILARDALYEIDVAGQRFPATPHLHAPVISSNLQKQQKYRPSVVSYKNEIAA